jgi:hypothetical protein
MPLVATSTLAKGCTVCWIGGLSSLTREYLLSLNDVKV